MRILDVRTLDGPNVHHHEPVLVARLALDELAGVESSTRPEFVARLRAALPGIHDHTCGLGYPGGFIERLENGTYFGHVVEHVALELSEAAGIGVNYGKTRETDIPGVYTVVVRSRCAPAMRALLDISVALVAALLENREFPLDKPLADVREIVRRRSLGPSTGAIAAAAQARGYPVAHLGNSVVRIGYGVRRRLVQAAMADTTSAVAVEVAQDKSRTKDMLAAAFIPVPRGDVVSDEDAAVGAWKSIGGPVVVKPLDGNQGRGITIGANNEAAVRLAFARARHSAIEVIVEQFLSGRDYRALVVSGRLVAASLRTPAHVVGDGRRTIRELVDMVNADPARGDGHDRPLTRLALDDVAECCLREQALAADDRPEKGRQVLLRRTANLSTGGTAEDVTDRVHDEVRAACERAARLIGLDICGIDLVTDDIAAPFAETGGGIVEVNASPGLRMHLFPSSGPSRDVGAAIVDALYPDGKGARIPIVSITGTNGKTTTARMIAHVWAFGGVRVGLTTTDGISIDGRPVAVGDMTGPRSAATVLGDPAVEAAVLETARGGIVRGGLGYDWSDVGVITNVQLDHIGQDGIRTVEDLVHIKSLVAERVREGGTLVLNADDPHVASLATAPRIASVRREVSYFSRFPNHVRIRSHLSAGGRAYYPRNGWIVEEQGGTRTPVVAISDIPVTRRGAAQFNVVNALAAVAAVRAVGVDVGVVARALTTFTDAANPGRVNVFRVGDAQVIVDYGHNPHAFTAMGLLTASWPASRVTAVIAVPGDRADSVIEEAGRAAARAFDRIIVKEDDDPRGRARHEISRRLCEAIQRERPGRDCQVVLDEREALTRALRDAQPRELVVVFYDDYEAVMGVLRMHGAEAASVPAAAPDDRRDSSERGDVQVEAYAEADRAAR